MFFGSGLSQTTTYPEAMAEQSTHGLASASSDATNQLDKSRQVHVGQQYAAVQELYWRQANNKRSAPTPAASSIATPAEVVDEAAMEVEAEITTPSLLQPFSLQNDAALEVTVAALGINPQDHNAVKKWLDQPVKSNREMFATMRAYHEQGIRPECYALIVQLETGLKTLNSNIFQVRKELSWMSADNRLMQKYACGSQLLTTGWPQGLNPFSARVSAWMDADERAEDSHLCARAWIRLRLQQPRGQVLPRSPQHRSRDGASRRGLLVDHNSLDLPCLLAEDCFFREVWRPDRVPSFYR